VGSPAFCDITPGLTFRPCFATLRRRQFYSRPPRLREADSNGLLWRARAVLAFSNMFHFFAHKLARLRAGRLTFTSVLVRAFDCVLFWHNKDVSPLIWHLDVQDRIGLRRTAVDLEVTTVINNAAPQQNRCYFGCDQISLSPCAQFSS
jgi:hypothetical protein